jgi:post-segregation antitoxin (ccd killing protein)
MLKLTATPTWQWSSANRHGSSSGSRFVNVRASPIDVKRTFLPRSLDVSFALRYRR